MVAASPGFGRRSLVLSIVSRLLSVGFEMGDPVPAAEKQRQSGFVGMGQIGLIL